MLRDDRLGIPERHLGLTTAEDGPLTTGQKDLLVAAIKAGVDMDGLLMRLPELPALSEAVRTGSKISSPPVRMGVARDNAFCFYYQDNLDLLAAAGVVLVPFSPLHDTRLPEDLNGLY